MLNREYKTVQIISYSSVVDSYGQQHTQQSSTRNVEMVCKIYSQSNVQDPRYINIEMIGITKDKSITTSNSVVIDGEKFCVKYIIPSGKYNQVLMERQ